MLVDTCCAASEESVRHNVEAGRNREGDCALLLCEHSTHYSKKNEHTENTHTHTR